MTPAPTELLRLADACERAIGPDRKLDAEIDAALFGGRASHTFDYSPHRNNPGGTVFVFNDPRHNNGYILLRDTRSSMPITASLDAAAALTERVLPGLGFNLDTVAAKCAVLIVGYDPDARGEWRAFAQAATPALALTAATLRAYASQIGGGR